MRIFVLSTFAAVTAMTASMLMQAPASAQTEATCAAAALLKGEQKRANMPCTPAVPKADSGQAAPCDPVAYSTAEQKHIGLPCTSPTPKAEGGNTAPCGPVSYSTAEQNYVSRPCTP
jgi:hypothetical protein